MLNLDTHILLYAVAGGLRPAERSLLARRRRSISAIVLWEIAKLAQRGRIDTDLRDPMVLRVLESVHVWPITPEIASASARLDLVSDPADELIAATSLVHRVPLLTRDRRLRTSRTVPLA